MWVIVVCIALVFVGLVAVVRWGGLAVEPPPTPAQDAPGPTGTPPVSLVVRRYLWYLAVAAVSGAAAGILAAGAGGRLVMRLLAVTAGADAQGRITEAEEVVGRITVDGTLGFVVFTGLFFGTVSGAAYLLLRRWLPAGRAGGLAYGALLLVVAGTRLEPLRRGNPDFDLVGPGWVSGLGWVPGPGPDGVPLAGSASTAAAISVSGIAVAADSSASCAAASADDRPSRSISAPLAIATTDSWATEARMRSSSRRWWSITAIRRSMSSSRPATITRLP